MPRKKNWHSLSEYQALRAVMEGNTTASAALRLGLSQSAVSRSLTSLEARVGMALFERQAGRLTPTAAAVSLNARLDALFEALDSIDGPSEVERAPLRLIAPPTFTSQFLIQHIAQFTKAHPEFYLSLEIGSSRDVINGITEDRFDLGMIGVELTRAGARLMPFRRSLAVCALPVGHPLCARDSIAPEDLDGEDLIVTSYRHARRAQLEKLLIETGSHPHLVAEVSTSSAAIKLVQAGLGLSVINPFPSSQTPHDGVVLRPFASAITYQTYFVAPDHRPISRTARHFMQHVRLHTPKDDFSEAP